MKNMKSCPDSEPADGASAPEFNGQAPSTDPCSEMSPPLRRVEQALTHLLNVAEDVYLALSFALAVIVANLDENADPTWGIIVAPPSSAKTEILMGCATLPKTFLLSDLTANTFASGAHTLGGGDASLLPRLTGKTLILKDFTTVLQMQRDRRGEIVAQLREIFDGRFNKSWGNGKQFDWEGRMGLLAAVTGVIDTHYAVLSALGERFLYFRMLVGNSERAAAARKALLRGESRTEREELQRAVCDLMTKVDITNVAKEPTGGLLDVFAALADLTARARTPVHRDGYTHEIISVAGAEGPGRVAKQLWSLARGHAAIRGATAVDHNDLALVRRVAADSIPPVRWMILQCIAAFPRTGIFLSELRPNAPSLRNFGKTTRKRCSEELERLGLIKFFQSPFQVNGATVMADAAIMTPEAQQLWWVAFGGPPDTSEQGSTGYLPNQGTPVTNGAYQPMAQR